MTSKIFSQRGKQIHSAFWAKNIFTIFNEKNYLELFSGTYFSCFSCHIPHSANKSQNSFGFWWKLPQKKSFKTIFRLIKNKSFVLENFFKESSLYKKNRFSSHYSFNWSYLLRNTSSDAKKSPFSLKINNFFTQTANPTRINRFN